MVSVPVVPKLNPNHVGIGSRTERLRVRNKEAGKVLMLFPAFFLYLSFMPFAHGNRYLARDRSTESRICEAWYQSGVNVTI